MEICRRACQSLRKLFEISETEYFTTSSHFSIHYLICQKPLPQPFWLKEAWAYRISMAGNQCYICWGDDGELISPCSCRGTGGYVHEDCLRDWFTNRGEWLDLDCPQCKDPFYGPIGVDLASFALSQIQGEHGVDSTTSAQAMGCLLYTSPSPRD